MQTQTKNGTKVQIQRFDRPERDTVYQAFIGQRMMGSDEVRRDLVSWVQRQTRDSYGNHIAA